MEYPDYTRIAPPTPHKACRRGEDAVEQRGALFDDAVVLMDTCLTQSKFCFWQASQHGENKPIKHSTLAALPLFLKFFFFGVFLFLFSSLGSDIPRDRSSHPKFVTLMWV
jgi:hypothetical protein